MLHDSQHVKKACVRQVVLDKWFPLTQVCRVQRVLDIVRRDGERPPRDDHARPRRDERLCSGGCATAASRTASCFVRSQLCTILEHVLRKRLGGFLVSVSGGRAAKVVHEDLRVDGRLGAKGEIVPALLYCFLECPYLAV